MVQQDHVIAYSREDRLIRSVFVSPGVESTPTRHRCVYPLASGAHNTGITSIGLEFE